MRTALIIDNDEMIRLALSDALTEEGYGTASAVNWREAVELVKGQEFDAVLIDLVMPEKNGIETMLELKKLRPDLPMIIMTGHGDIPTAVEAIRLGAYDYMTKPLDQQRLIITLNNAGEHANALKKIISMNRRFQSMFQSMRVLYRPCRYDRRYQPFHKSLQPVPT